MGEDNTSLVAVVVVGIEVAAVGDEGEEGDVEGLMVAENDPGKTAFIL